jgi:hypothetical protein
MLSSFRFNFYLIIVNLLNGSKVPFQVVCSVAMRATVSIAIAAKAAP